MEEIKIESMTVKQQKDFLKRRGKKTSVTKNHRMKLAKLLKNHEDDLQNDVHALDLKIL